MDLEIYLHLEEPVFKMQHFGVDKEITGATYEWAIFGSGRITFPNGNTAKM